MSERRFPILLGRGYGDGERLSIPWNVIDGHEGQALLNHSQTLERLAARGGLGPDEAVCVMRGEKWHAGYTLDDLMQEVEKNLPACRHGWRGAPLAERIEDRCPRCGNRTIFIGSGGHLTCSWLECKEPGVGVEIERIQKERDRYAAALDACRVRLERIREIDDLALEGLRAIEDATKPVSA